MGADRKRRGKFPALSIVMFVLAGIAGVLAVYFILSSASVPSSFRGISDLLTNAFGPVISLAVEPIKRAIGWGLALLGLVHLLLGGALVGLAFVLRNHRDLAERVQQLEARLGEKTAG